ncbi:MAG: aerobic carbon-monoxide dehydrogenase large subunit [Solirubrobacteraceae bacterium]|jgi:carbon-monoxide dehydrogenase large subunit|nr:aerobic carbon-monoxide dehydrogenase large subunit [Solirubrobacteraceae bacterium]
MSILGNRVTRSEDPRFITGAATFGDDVKAQGALHATFVRSILPHARITNIDTSAVAEIPGALAFTGADVALEPLPVAMPGLEERMPRPVIARDVARFAGEIVAVVLTEDRLHGPDAAERVVVDVDELPPVADPRSALDGDTLLFPDVGTNVCARFPLEDADPNLFDDCEVVVTTRFHSQRLASCPMECRVAVAEWGADGRLTHWATTQTPHATRDALAGALGIEASQIRVRVPDVGGGFGPKGGAPPEDILVAWLAREVGRPVRWTETRTENMLALGHGRAQHQELTLGGDRDGTLKAYKMDIVQDSGAYPEVGAILPMLTKMCASGPYAIPKIEVDATSVVTNTTPITAYRGAGRPEATQAIERAIDVFAIEAGLDPAEVRRKNLIPADAFPYATASGAHYDSGDYATALDLALEHSGYEELRAEQRRRRESNGASQIGIGLCAYIEITNGFAEPEWGSVEITKEGGATVRTGLGPTGQGHQTALAMLASDRLGVPLASITVEHGDTDLIPRGTGTYGSRSLQAGGAAVDGAAIKVVEKAKEIVADELEASPADLVLDADRGVFHVAGVPAKSISWGRLASTLDAGDRLAELAMEEDFKPPSPTWPFGAHVAVVEVDTETGKVKLVRMVCVDDCGTILNPLLVDGQRHGGIAQGVAQALMEEFAYDELANPVTDNFVTYSPISAAELPAFELVSMETPTPVNPLGAKGIGESTTIGSTSAAHNAVIDALTPLGVRDVEMPTTSQRVWLAIQAAAGGSGAA